jgi:tetratricopeptide (TPR) repeat protein
MARLVLIAALLAATPGADEHLLAGAQHFRAGRFPQALIEFRVAGKLGSGEASWYAAASLVKLDRPEEAIEAFAEAEKTAPAARDALLDYYRALACYGARLYLCADKLLAEVGNGSGPRIAEQVRQTREKIAALFVAPPGQGAIDWYREKAAVARAAKRPALSAAYRAEAEALAARMK